MTWKRNLTVEQLNNLNANTIVEHLAIEIVEKGDDYIIAKMPVNTTTHQPMGLLHGGASCVLAETLGSMASVCAVESEGIPNVVGVEINANHLRPVRSGYVIGKVTPVKIGRKIHVWDITIHDEEGKKCCVSRLTVMVIN